MTTTSTTDTTKTRTVQASQEALISLAILTAMHLGALSLADLRALRGVLGATPREIDTALAWLLENHVISRIKRGGRVLYSLIEHASNNQNTPWSSHTARTIYDRVQAAANEVTPWLDLGEGAAR